MPKTKHNKSKKRKPGLTDNEKLIKKAHNDGIINDPPKNSLAIQAAEQSKALRDHIRNPEQYISICNEIIRNPSINSFAEYGAKVLRGAYHMPKQQAEYLVYQLRAFRTFESWKRMGQTYVVSAPLVNHLLSQTETIHFDVSKIALPFNRFYVDLGFLEDGQRVGFFANKHRKQPRIDFVFIKGEHICSVTLNKYIAIARPEKCDCHLDDVRYLNFVITAIMDMLDMSEEDPGIEVYDEDCDYRTCEWRSYLSLKGEPPLLGAAHWINHLGAISWSGADIPQVSVTDAV